MTPLRTNNNTYYLLYLPTIISTYTVCNFFQIKSNIWAFFSFTFDVFASLNKMVESRERRTVNPFFSVLWIHYFHKYMGMYLIKPISAGCQPTSLLLVHTWFPITFVRQLWAGTAWKWFSIRKKKFLNVSYLPAITIIHVIKFIKPFKKLLDVSSICILQTSSKN
jgi:hypothetical protein